MVPSENACEIPGGAGLAPPAFAERRARSPMTLLAKARRWQPVLLRLASFLVVGLAGLATDSAAFWLLFKAGAPLALARAVSLALATLVTWLLNRTVTFDPSGRSALAEALRYAAVALVVQGFNYALFLTLVFAFPPVPPLVLLVIAAVTAAGFSFIGQSVVAFRALKIRLAFAPARLATLNPPP